MPFTKDNATEHGRKGGQKRQEKLREEKAIPAPQLVKEIASGEAASVMRRMIKAALGREEFSKLDHSKQVDAMKVVLSYGVGPAPRIRKDSEPPEEPPASEASLV